MEKLTVDLTYGHALFNAAKERGKIYEIKEEFDAVSEIFAENPLLKKLFGVPTVTVREKKAVAEKVFGGWISQELLNFIFILIDKRRIGAWEGIGKEYERLVWEKDKHARGVLYSVVPIEGEKLKAFEFKTDAMIGKRIQLENRIDKSLIGGVKIYVDGKLIDASVRTRLENMKQRIKQ